MPNIIVYIYIYTLLWVSREVRFSGRLNKYILYFYTLLPNTFVPILYISISMYVHMYMYIYTHGQTQTYTHTQIYICNCLNIYLWTQPFHCVLNAAKCSADTTLIPRWGWKMFESRLKTTRNEVSQRSWSVQLIRLHGQISHKLVTSLLACRLVTSLWTSL